MIKPGLRPKPPFLIPTILQRNAIEPLLGALVVAVIAFILFAIYAKSVHRGATTYALNAWFPAIDGLQTGCDVRIGGVKVGEVADISIDPKTYLVLIKLNLNSKIKVPSDSVASVSSEGLLGSKYLELLPGTSNDMLKSGARIYDTKAPVSLYRILGQFISGPPSTGGKDGAARGGQPASPAGPPAQIPAPAGASLP